MNDLLTKAETADLLRVTRRTLERERAAQHIRGIRIGGRIFFSRQEIERYIQNRTDKFTVPDL